MSAGLLKWPQRVLFAFACIALGYCAYVVTDAWIFQQRQNAALERLLPGEGQAPAPAKAESSKESKPAAGQWDGLIGRIDVRRLGMSVIVVEGTDTPTLARAAGHIAGTSLPGEPGNVGIAAHRDTFFRPLRNIRENDVIAVTTRSGKYRYRVVSMSVVSPEDVSVLNSDGTDVLTLVTCYPFSFIGSAPDRFVIRAEEIRTPMQPSDEVPHPKL